MSTVYNTFFLILFYFVLFCFVFSIFSIYNAYQTVYQYYYMPLAIETQPIITLCKGRTLTQKFLKMVEQSWLALR